MGGGTVRPVYSQYPLTQAFGAGATAGIAADARPASGVGYLVYRYGNYQPDGHAGADIGCPVGTPVRAARSGTVLWCDWDVNLPGGPNDWASRWFFYQRFGGRLLLVQHAPGDIDVYAHLSAWKVQKGQFVNEGDLIALSGDSSGGQDGALGPHLHQERIVDLNYPTGAGKIYGRIDPTTVWGGIAAQGTITQEDDDLALFENETVFRDKVIAAVFDARFDTRDEKNTVTGTISLRDMLTYYPANVAIDRRQVRDGLAASVKSIVDAVKAGQTVDPDAVAAQIADKLDGLTFSIARKEG
jgi:hypothetical protein